MAFISFTKGCPSQNLTKSSLAVASSALCVTQLLPSAIKASNGSIWLGRDFWGAPPQEVRGGHKKVPPGGGAPDHSQF
jgi:hypothetical protein